MKAIKAKITKGLNIGSTVEPCDNSGAKLVRIVGIKRSKTVKGRAPSAGIGDLVLVSVKKGKPELRKQVVMAVIVRQRRPFKRPEGTRVVFEDNALVLVKDDTGTPRGTLFKGPIAKEVTERWPPIAKLARIVL